MAQPNSSSCRVGENTRQPLTPEDLAFTLPFKLQDVPPNVFKLAVRQTRKRWAWFSKSRELDATMGTALGTLGYFPWETRRQIIKELFDNVLWEERDTWTYNGQKNWPYWLTLLRDRLSSPTLRLEFDDFFFSNSIFKFKCSSELGKFLGQLSNFHETKLRRIIISIRVPCGWPRPHLRRYWRNGWETMYLQLPASLQQVSFDLDCILCRLDAEAEKCRHHWEQVNLSEIKAAGSLVEVLSKWTGRSVPGAVVEMHKTAKKRLLPEHLELFIAAVNDVER